MLIIKVRITVSFSNFDNTGSTQNETADPIPNAIALQYNTIMYNTIIFR